MMDYATQVMADIERSRSMIDADMQTITAEIARLRELITRLRNNNAALVGATSGLLHAIDQAGGYQVSGYENIERVAAAFAAIEAAIQVNLDDMQKQHDEEVLCHKN